MRVPHVWRALLAALVLMPLSCTKTRQVPPYMLSPQEVEHAGQVTVRTVDRLEVQLVRPRLEDSQITGTRADTNVPLSIPLSRVASVEFTSFDAGKTLIALLVTPIVIVGGLAILAAGSSCPFLYTDDGQGYALEGELYAGAVFPALQRPDYLLLEHLKAVRGRYTLRLADEAHETQYTDELVLLAVDHPAGVHVLPDAGGGLHAVGAARPAISARDYLGRDVLARVSAADAVAWSAEPFARDSADPAQLRDGVIVHFPAPRAGAPAKLVVRMRNTAWADYVLARYFGLMGGAMQTWSATQTGADARGRATRFLRDQGYALGVELLKDRAWTPLGSFQPTGPAAWQTEVLPLTLTASVGDTVTIRLDGGALFWSIDYVALDTSPDLPLHVTELRPRSAQADDGRDVKDLLAAADGHFQVLPDTGSSVLLTYDAPPVPPGLGRTVVARASGYYQIHPSSGAAPDYATLAEIQQKPNGLLHWSLREFRRLTGNGAGRASTQH